MLKRILYGFNHKIGRLVCRSRPTFISEMLVEYLKIFIDNACNKNWDFSTNGESRVLECLVPLKPVCIFDVGANEGEWSMMARKLFPDCTIHAFEIVPSTFEILEEKTAPDPEIVANCIGLSDDAGKVTINLSSSCSTIATANKIDGMAFHDTVYDQTIELSVTTGMLYLEQNKISQIDLLKIDVEGMDLRVLKGFGESINFVRMIQFEYGVFNISSRDLLVDFFNLLRDRGFVIGKIFPNFVYFFEYHFSHEDFGGHNYVAVKKSELELIRRLSGKY